MIAYLKSAKWSCLLVAGCVAVILAPAIMDSSWVTNGTIHLYGGKVLLNGGKVTLADDCCCGGSEPAAPCECPCDATEWAALVADGTPCHGLVAAYRIKGYTPGDFTACSSCDNSALPAWPGTFTVINDAVICRWLAVLDDDTYSISGKRMDSLTVVRLSAPDCQWLLRIYCFQAPITVHLIWEGTKDTGSTPAGIYTKTASTMCDSTSTIEIEAVP